MATIPTQGSELFQQGMWDGKMDFMSGIALYVEYPRRDYWLGYVKANPVAMSRTLPGAEEYRNREDDAPIGKAMRDLAIEATNVNLDPTSEQMARAARLGITI